MSKRTRKKPQSVTDRLRFIAAHIDSFKSWLRSSGYRRTTIGHLEKYSLEAGRSAIEVAAVSV